jgi:hypothetical protein
MAAVAAMVLALAGVCSSAQAAEGKLTGKWSINTGEGDTYYLRQVDDEVWWIGESKDGGKSWTNIGHGHVKGNELTMRWADSPRGSYSGSGTVTFELVTKEGQIVELKKKKQEGPGTFGGDTLKRLK